jgi:hypothetical protein
MCFALTFTPIFPLPRRVGAIREPPVQGEGEMGCSGPLTPALSRGGEREGVLRFHTLMYMAP